MFQRKLFLLTLLLVGFVGIPASSVSAYDFVTGSTVTGTDDNSSFTRDTSFGDGSWNSTTVNQDGSMDHYGYNAETGHYWENHSSANEHRDNDGSVTLTNNPNPTNPIDPADYQPGWPDLKPIDISFTPVGQKKVIDQQNMEVGRYTPSVKIKNVGCLATNYEAPEGAEQYKDWFNRAVKEQQKSAFNYHTDYGETLAEETPSLFERFVYSFTNVAHAGKKGRKYLKNMSKLPCGNIYDVFKNAGAKGKNGSFPVVLRIDLNDDGKFNNKTVDGVQDYIEVKTVGPLAIKESKTISFPRVKLLKGRYLTDVIIDPLNGDYSCGGNFGCIDEPRGAESKTANGIEERVKVAEPSMTLGTFLRNYPEKHNWKDERVIDRTNKDNTRDQVGLWWKGNSVDLSQCEGWMKTPDGKDSSTFNGYPNSRNTYTTSILGTNKYDRNIKEPQTGETYKYVIRCRSSVFGKWTSDSVFIRAKEADELYTDHDLYPTLSDIYADPGEEITSITFVAYNSTTTDFSDVAYELSIEGTTYGTAGVIASLPAESDLEVDVDGSWFAPDIISTTSMRVTLTHLDLDGPSSAQANIIVDSDVPPDTCHDDKDNDNDDLYDIDDPDCPDDGGGGDETTCDNPDGCDEDDGGPTCEDREDNDLDGLTDGEDPDCPDTCPDDDPDCTGGENNPNLPTISAYPELVRQGDTTELTWELNGHPSCTLSSNVVANDVPDGSVSNPVTTDGDVDVEVQHMSIFSIDCGLVGASTTVRVLPSVEEN